jgi:hypothetical protein
LGQNELVFLFEAGKRGNGDGGRCTAPAPAIPDGDRFSPD